MVHVFLDANVLVSAALTPESVLHRLWSEPEVRLHCSPHVVAESRRNATGEAASRLERLLEGVSVLPAEPAPFPLEGALGLPGSSRQVLMGAVVSGADVLLTGDIRHFGALMGSTVCGVTVRLPGDFLRGLLGSELGPDA